MFVKKNNIYLPSLPFARKSRLQSPSHKSHYIFENLMISQKILFLSRSQCYKIFQYFQWFLPTKLELLDRLWFHSQTLCWADNSCHGETLQLILIEGKWSLTNANSDDEIKDFANLWKFINTYLYCKCNTWLCSGLTYKC